MCCVVLSYTARGSCLFVIIPDSFTQSLTWVEKPKIIIIRKKRKKKKKNMKVLCYSTAGHGVVLWFVIVIAFSSFAFTIDEFA